MRLLRATAPRNSSPMLLVLDYARLQRYGYDGLCRTPDAPKSDVRREIEPTTHGRGCDCWRWRLPARFKAASGKQRYDSRSEVTPPAHREEDGPAGVRSMPVGCPLREARMCMWAGNLPGRCCVWLPGLLQPGWYYWVRGRLTSCLLQKRPGDTDHQGRTPAQK